MPATFLKHGLSFERKKQREQSDDDTRKDNSLFARGLSGQCSSEYCTLSPQWNIKKDLLLNTNPGLNTALWAQLFCSSWREIDHTPELILNHSTPDALSPDLCPLLSKQGAGYGRVKKHKQNALQSGLCALFLSTWTNTCMNKHIHTYSDHHRHN